MPKFRIRAKHEIYVTYIVEEATYDAAIETLCQEGQCLFSEYSSGTFGVDDYLAQKLGIEVDEDEYDYSGACPTGSYWPPRQQWDWEEVEEEEEDDSK